MPKPENLLRDILSDMKVELTDEFDRNFERKGFFDSKWAPRKNPSPKLKGTLMVVTGNLRKSLRAAVVGRGVRFTSPYLYADLHNRGGKFTQTVRAHSRTAKKTGKKYTVKSYSRTGTMPQRQFIGDHQQVRGAISEIIYDNVSDYFENLAKELKK